MMRGRGVCGAALLTAFVVTAPVFADQTAPPPSSPPGGVPGLPQTGLPPRDVQRRTGTSRLRGRVIAADTGLPLRRATVRAMAAELREAVTTLTGADGQYELKELPAGRYTVTAGKGAYPSLAYGQTRPLESGRPIDLGDNDRVDLRLPRGGVITGVITDEFGEPVSDAQVMALPQQYVNGQRRLFPAGRSATSDNVGGFRVFGLMPGTYYLSVVQRAHMTIGARSDDRTGYAPT